jgi:NADH-quinone oxidoreductase subunit H
MDITNIIFIVIQAFVLVLLISTGFAYLTLLERRSLARFQNRVGPNRAGPWGLLQPAADAVKLFFKEDIIPEKSDRWVYLLAPSLAVITALVIWAVIPIGCFNLAGDYRACFDPVGLELNNVLQMTDVNIGILYLLAITSVGVYGITLAGWSSNSKYAMLGGIRSSAQLISYELALGMTVMGAVMLGSTLSTQEIVHAQQDLWFFIPQILGFAVFLISANAELVRAPFDLVEAEQELTSGYNTEYSSMKFALFFMAEYIKMIALSAVGVTLFLGGWQFPFLAQIGGWVEGLAGPWVATTVVGIVSMLSFAAKALVLLFGLIWLRATLPRMRYDQLMELGWKWLLPLALLNLLVTPVIIVLVPNLLIQTVVLFGFGIIALLVVDRLGRARLNAPTSRVRLVNPVASGRRQNP